MRLRAEPGRGAGSSKPSSAWAVDIAELYTACIVVFVPCFGAIQSPVGRGPPPPLPERVCLPLQSAVLPDGRFRDAARARHGPAAHASLVHLRATRSLRHPHSRT